MIEKLAELDGSILLWIQEHIRNGFLDPAAKFVTYLGNGGWLWIALCVVFLIMPKTRLLGFFCSVSLAAEYIFANIFLKNLIARTRPYEAVEGLTRIIGAQSDYSFPSGHSGASFAVAVVMFREMPRKFGVPALVLASLISLSRLYVGVHYPSDVLGGMIIGTAFGCLECCLYHSLAETEKKMFEPDN